LQKLRGELERTLASLDEKNELLINAMMKNFGKTEQELPNFRLPEIAPRARQQQPPSLLEMAELYGGQERKPKGFQLLKPNRWSGRPQY